MVKETCDCGSDIEKEKVKVKKPDYIQYLLLLGISVIIFLIMNKKC